MIIKGKIINTVRLNDIGKSVEYGKEVSLTEYEVNRSKDLQNAINRDWVEIVYDRSMLKRAVAVQGHPQEKHSEEEILDIAKKMAQSMAEEMLKNSPLVKEIAKEVAKEMVVEIKDNLKLEKVINVPNENKVENKSLEINDPSNVFVDFKDEEVGMKANINRSGTVEIQKDDLTSSLEKMKRFRQSQNK